VEKLRYLTIGHLGIFTIFSTKFTICCLIRICICQLFIPSVTWHSSFSNGQV